MTKYSSDTIKPAIDTIKLSPTSVNPQISDTILKEYADNSLDTVSADSSKVLPTNADLKLSDTISKKYTDNSSDTAQLSTNTPEILPTNVDLKLSDNTISKKHKDNSSDTVQLSANTPEILPTNVDLKLSDNTISKKYKDTLDTAQLPANAKIPKVLRTDVDLKLSDTILKKHSNNTLDTTKTSADTQKILQPSGDFRFSDPILKEHIEIVKESSHNQKVSSSYKSDWLTGVLFVSFILLALTRFYHNKYLSKIIGTIFSYQASLSLFNEKNAANLRGAITINLMFFVNAAIFLVEIIQHNKINTIPLQNLQLFFLCLISIVVIYSIKIIVFRIIGQVFNGNTESREYIHTVFIYNKNIGLFLFPLIVSVPFIMPYVVPALLNIGIFLIGFFYVLRVFRGLTILFRKHVSIFYMILYLCILELLPLLMLYKLLILFI